jgi:hypothetical protein
MKRILLCVILFSLTTFAGHSDSDDQGRPEKAGELCPKPQTIKLAKESDVEDFFAAREGLPEISFGRAYSSDLVSCSEYNKAVEIFRGLGAKKHLIGNLRVELYKGRQKPKPFAFFVGSMSKNGGLVLNINPNHTLKEVLEEINAVEKKQADYIHFFESFYKLFPKNVFISFSEVEVPKKERLEKILKNLEQTQGKIKELAKNGKVIVSLDRDKITVTENKTYTLGMNADLATLKEKLDLLEAREKKWSPIEKKIEADSKINFSISRLVKIEESENIQKLLENVKTGFSNPRLKEIVRVFVVPSDQRSDAFYKEGVVLKLKADETKEKARRPKN